MTADAPGRRALVALLGADALSTLGTNMTLLALPWFVLTTTGSPGRMGLVMAAEFVGIAALGIPSGHLPDRLGARRTMLLADVLRGVLIAMVPLLSWAGWLSFPLLLAIVFAVGAFFPAHSASQRILLAGIAGDDEALTTKAGGYLGATNEAASLAGPIVAGFLIAVVRPANILLIDAATYAGSVGLLWALVPRGVRSPAGEERAGLLGGIRFLFSDRLARPIAVSIGINELAWTALFAVIPVLAYERYGGSPRVAGWLLASFSAGSVAGGLLAARLARRVPPLRLARAAVLGMPLPLWVLVVPAPPAVVGAAVALNGLCTGLLFPPVMSLLTIRTPAPLRGQVIASAMTVFSAAGPLGLAGAGQAAQAFGSVTPVLVGVAVIASAAAAAFLGGTLGMAPIARVKDPL